MVRRTASSTILILGLALMGGQSAQANTPLTRAVVSSLRNQVRLLPSRNPARKAKLSDVLTPGDGIVTSRRSLAELRFNDGSLARMGEQAVFRFIPKTRSFRLSNGTVLMLIPPGQGLTQVRTPNVTAGIRGSALVIRYDKGTNTSTVIALTNSQISVTNSDQSQTQVLAAGQAVVTVDNEIVDSYDVDLQELYRTSPLLKDLELNNPDAAVKDEAIAQVREETLEGMRSQRQFAEGEGSDRTEDFRLSSSDMEAIIIEDGFGAVAEPASARFPGRSIGVDGRFNADDDVQLTVPPATQPAAAETPVTTIGGDQPPVAGAVDPPFVNEPVGGNAVNDVDDLPGGDDIADDVVTKVDDTPIAEVDVLPEEAPMFGDNTGALESETPGAEAELPIIIDSPVADIPLMDNPVSENPADDLDDLPGGDDIAGDLTETDNAPISEADSLPDEIDLPAFGNGDTAALEPELPGESEEMSPPDGMIGDMSPETDASEMDTDLHPATVDLDLTVTVDGEEQEFEREEQESEQVDKDVFQGPDATVEPSETEVDWGS